MNRNSVLGQLINANQWEVFQPLMDEVQQWSQWDLFLSALERLNTDALYTSQVHGLGHIERTLLHGAFCAMAEGLQPEDTALLLDACSYHDVGRINDWYDEEHGHRSAERLAELTGRTGQELIMLQAAVDAHSRKDDVLEETLRSYSPQDYSRTLLLAQLLKDADGLDRVRIHDLKTSFLRRAASVKRADFALYLFGRYEVALALAEPYANGKR
jgi:hypothetical protein